MAFQYASQNQTTVDQLLYQDMNSVIFNQFMGNAAAVQQMSMTLSGSPLLKRGDRGERVETLQKMLNKVGATLEEDGIFGLQTHRAVRLFQGNQGLSKDAIVGPLTAKALNNACMYGAHLFSSQGPANDTDESTETLTSTTLKRGSAGAAVRELQTLLNHHNAGLVVDGEFGSLTENAVRAFQMSNNFDVTGIATASTIQALQSGEAKSIGETMVVEAENVQEWRDAVMSKAANHVGKLYSWGGDGPTVFDCSGFVLYVLRQDTGLVQWGDDTAAGISNRVAATTNPQKGDLVFYSGGNGITHIEFYTGSGTQTLGASGGGSNTHANDPNAKVQYGDYSRDGRTKTFGSISNLIAQRINR